MNSSINEYIESIIPGDRLLFDEPMNKHTTFRVGGKASCLIKISEKEQLVKLIPFLQVTEQDYFILGNGSNLLVGDKGYQGIVVKIGGEMNRIAVEGERMKVSAGTLLSKASAAARDNGLSGLEFASGIPGTVGGGIVMNAGAYGGEMKQIVESVEVMTREGEILVLDNDTMEFDYRTSVIKNRPFIVLETVLKMEHGDREEIGRRMEELSGRRKAKQPLEYPSAGSTFKRPEGNFAGKLIMDAGLRGYRIGGARVSEKHCGFIINDGTATSADVREVIEEVRQRVLDLFNVNLEPEIIFLGDF